MRRVDLARPPLVKRLLRSRWPQLLLTLAALAGFTFAIVTGFAGTPVGNRNFAVVFVWIAWWAALILLLVPVLGRGWCSVCPIPAPGEWLQRGAVLGPGGRRLGLERRWPKRFRNIWLQNAGFLLLALFAAVVLTRPTVTAIVLLGILVIATGTSLVFERRAFCRYLCPVGGFIGLYSQLAPVELRVKDTSVCASHRDKTCYTGNADGYGCPWNVYPAGLVKNINCGLCFECVRACPYDNLAFNLRAPGADLTEPRGRRLDEAYKAFIMLGAAVIYSAVMLGPWGWLKTAAYAVGSLEWLAYVAAFLAFILVLLPGCFLLAVRLGQALAGGELARKAFASLAYSLVPLGLGAWIAFSVSFVFANGSYIWPALSDPLGWGWDIAGTAGVSWSPYLTGLVPELQAITLLGGFVWSGITTRRIAGQLLDAGQRGKDLRLATPVLVFSLAVTVLLLALLVG
ncbi:MAG: 4Fe-4S binding protein [Gemmatimonadetes bacterium]|nr:4Fe-4S binding protein [Gemmatimonadota bacterium]